MDQVLTQPVILTGNSMGGFLMLVAALCRPEKVHSLVGICPGFGSYFQKTGRREICYQDTSIKIGFESEPVNYHFIDQKLEIDKPIRLIHGLDDDLVPAKTSQNIAEQVSSTNVQVHYIKGCNHKFDHPLGMARVCRSILDMRE
jgi:pimeloyl-ACP methyl ester carboxylesterase